MIWILFGQHLGDMWTSFGHNLDIILTSLRHHLRTIWGPFEDHLELYICIQWQICLIRGRLRESQIWVQNQTIAIYVFYVVDNLFISGRGQLFSLRKTANEGELVSLNSFSHLPRATKRQTHDKHSTLYLQLTHSVCGFSYFPQFQKTINRLCLAAQQPRIANGNLFWNLERSDTVDKVVALSVNACSSCSV